MKKTAARTEKVKPRWNVAEQIRDRRSKPERRGAARGGGGEKLEGEKEEKTGGETSLLLLRLQRITCE